MVVPGGPVIMGVDNRHEHFMVELKHGKKAEALRCCSPGGASARTACRCTFHPQGAAGGVKAAGADVEEIFGKPVMFFEMLEAMQAERGPEFDAWAAREEILAMQERWRTRATRPGPAPPGDGAPEGVEEARPWRHSVPRSGAQLPLGASSRTWPGATRGWTGWR